MSKGLFPWVCPRVYFQEIISNWVMQESMSNGACPGVMSSGISKEDSRLIQRDKSKKYVQEVCPDYMSRVKVLGV